MQHAAVSLLLATTLVAGSAGPLASSPELADKIINTIDRAPTQPQKDKDLALNGVPASVPSLERAADEAMTLTPPAPAQQRASMDDICATLRAAAMRHELPVPFFARLIWQESRFNPDAKSRAGALGIAQFMPKTADWRGLSDPLDPIAALHESAEYLHELRTRFGNLGFAAAAYNGGSGRVEAWLKSKKGVLPRETRDYVRVITGVNVEQWRADKAWHKLEQGVSGVPARIPCPQLTAELGQAVPLPPLKAEPKNATAPAKRTAAPRITGAEATKIPVNAKLTSGTWWVQIAGNWSEEKAKAHYASLQRKFKSLLGEHKPLIVKHQAAGRGPAKMSQVRVAQADRSSAEKLCAKLRAGGANCVVMRNT